VARMVKLVSDVSGTEADEGAFVRCVVRSHPAVDEAKRLDVLPGELAVLDEVTDLVVLEIGSGSAARRLVVAHAAFRAVVPDETVVRARGTRGRLVGWSPHDRG
jgi:hypothetical protein